MTNETKTPHWIWDEEINAFGKLNPSAEDPEYPYIEQTTPDVLAALNAQQQRIAALTKALQEADEMLDRVQFDVVRGVQAHDTMEMRTLRDKLAALLSEVH